MAKQVIYRRGTTAEHANFVGANGEITVDTVKHVVIVHDGVTAGGFPLANASTITANISALTANAANQAAAITVLQANAATQSNAIVALQSNAVVQQAAIDAFTLASNSTVIFANIAGVRANVEAANVQIGLLFGNSTIQNEAIVLANANITALQSSITAANLAIASFVAGTGFANITQLTANITAVNSAISTQGVTFATNVAVDAVRANVTAANSAISALQANIAAANVAINNIALSPALIDLVALAVSPVVTNGAFYSNSNLAGYLSSQNITSANIGAYQTYGNLTFSTVANAATQAASINTINANVTAANAAIQSLSANIGTLVAGVPGALDTLIELGNALGNNASFSATMVNWLGNITSNVTAANGSITTLQTQVYANANVATYLPTYSGNIAANIVKNGYTWNFGADGNLTLPGNLVIAGNTSVFGTDAALIQSTDDLRLLTLSSGANGAVSSVWVEDIGNVGTSNIAAVYANPTVGSKIVRIVVGQNGVGSGPNLWDFGADGNLTLPETGYLKVGAGIVAGFLASPAPIISGFSNISAQNFTFLANGVNILSAVGAYQTFANANAATQATSINTINNTLTSSNVAIGLDTGSNAQSSSATAVGAFAGYDTQGIQTVAIGRSAGYTNQKQYAVAIGSMAGSDFQGAQAVAIGADAGYVTQGAQAVAIGLQAGQVSQGTNTVAIGSGAGQNTQGVSAVAIGFGAGTINQGNNSIILNATGSALNQTRVNTFTVAPVRNDVATANVAQVLFYNTTSKEVTYGNTISIAGNITAGNITTGVITLTNGAKIRDTAGDAVAFGQDAGNTNQGTSAVAIGQSAGETAQGVYTVAIGNSAGRSSQGSESIAIGSTAGRDTQGAFSVAVGLNAGRTSQGGLAVAIGYNAGLTSQGQEAVAIGYGAGQTSQATRSIILNATGSALNQTTPDTFTVAPVRNDVANVTSVMFYNTTSKEITYGNTISVAGNINASQFNFANGVNILSTVTGTYGNANVASYLPTYSGNVRALNFVGAIQAQVGSSFAYSLNAFGAGSDTGGVFLPADINSNAVVAGYTIVSNAGVTLTVTSASFVAGTPNFISVSTTPTASSFLYPATVYSADYSPALPLSTITVGNATISGNVTAPRYLFANGVNILSTVAGTYSNANVTSYFQSLTSLALGSGAGATAQGVGSVALGVNAGNDQGYYAVAIGIGSGRVAQSDSAVAVGGEAGWVSQGINSVAVGYRAGTTNQANSSIILNATGANLNATTANTFTVAPVRNDVANVAEIMFYNTTSKEITYGNTISIAGQVLVNSAVDSYTANTGALQVAGGVGVAGNLFVGGNIIQAGAYYEKYASVTNSGGNLTCNFANGSTFYATLTANVTANFTNVAPPIGGSYSATGATIIVDQGATAYRVANVQIDGVNQTVRWVGAAAGVGTANNTDVMSFSLINLGGGSNWRVLGQISNYG